MTTKDTPEHVAEAIREYSAAYRAQVGAHPIGVVDLLADRDVADAADARTERGDGKRNDETGVPRPTVSGEIWRREIRSHSNGFQLRGRQLPGHCRRHVTEHDADEGAEQARVALAPDAEAHHRCESQGGDDVLSQIHRLCCAD